MISKAENIESGKEGQMATKEDGTGHTNDGNRQRDRER